ncbi:MAG: DNA-binding response regulator [Candidatus Roseilinea sp.]|nr:MAG: DNA-binding response regulator [Candidatus Roseilinea sp.]
MSIRVLIADDHTLVRSGLRALLDNIPGVTVIGEAADGRQALALIQKDLPDIVLMDVGMAGLSGLEATLQVVKRHPQVRVIIVSMHKNEEYIMQALQAGASGYLFKDSAASELEQSIRAVMRGEQYLCPEGSRRVGEYEERFGFVFDHASRDGTGAGARSELTLREREVLQLVAEGRTMQEIAAILGISVKTVETHRYRLMDKLNIHHVTGLVRHAIKIGLVQVE